MWKIVCAGWYASTRSLPPHWTVQSPAQSNCNLNYKENSRCIPVVFHNLFGYDTHFIIEEILRVLRMFTVYDGYIELLPIMKEKYISFTKHINSIKNSQKNYVIMFHSYKFLASSLNKLSSFLSKDKLRILQHEFCNLSQENFNFLERKGISYKYIDGVEKLNELCLPSRIILQFIDERHGVRRWLCACCQRVAAVLHSNPRWSDLYLKTDILLLADIFKNFQDCITSYGSRVLLPGFTWDAMLKYTGIKFEFLTDIDMVIEHDIRGGDVTWTNVPTNMPTINTCSHIIYRNRRCALCTLTLITITMAGQCVNHYHISIFNGSTT